MEVEDDALVRDEFANALGGIRLPSMEVPISTYGPNNEGKPVCDPNDPSVPPPPDCVSGLFAFIGGLACRLSGTSEPFDQATLDALYPTHGGYVGKVTGRGLHLMAKRFLLLEDFDELLNRAKESGIGKGDCGRGFQTALVVPVLVVLGKLRRRRPRRPLA